MRARTATEPHPTHFPKIRRLPHFARRKISKDWNKLSGSRACRNDRYWQILLQKSFWGVERKFLEPLMRFTRGDAKGPYRFFQNRPRTFLAALKSYGVAEKSKDQLCENLGVVRFSTFATVSAPLRHDGLLRGCPLIGQDWK